MHTIDFYFDCSSPWTWLAFEHALKLFPEIGRAHV